MGLKLPDGISYESESGPELCLKMFSVNPGPKKKNKQNKNPKPFGSTVECLQVPQGSPEAFKALRVNNNAVCWSKA